MAVPQYDQHDGKIVYTEALCAGSKLLRVKSSTAPIDYLPGHVFALEVPKDGTEDPPGEGSNKGKHGDGTKGPYTVTRADAAKGTFDVVIRKIKGGRLSQRLASLRKGAPVSFGGKFKVPIAEGISDAASSICLISTGVGLGPLVGYLEQAENAGEQRPTKVFAGFRALSDVIFEEELEALAEDTDGRVRFQMCVSELRDERYPPPPGYEGLRDRVTRSVPQVLDPAELKTTHFHLIGNGGMVKTFQAALSKAGVPDEHVTIEMYFNHKEEVLDSEVEDMVKALQAPARSSEWVGAET
eukprot:CAMPEP_0177714258 /NCGR_PEP_ID=MMETSP0484_2-20121128/13369_1 /TAXON_ID=354590 /ORGANISM="Rhodomonas lens, Strain RHODO" /LENGTH=297 /DNA_ID=CAMNT_0019226187 /DNA_START=207 /DNA_END=1100 /DNA_ORIENTATION=+